MKKTTLSKIFGVAVVIALLASLFVAAVPGSALSTPSVTPASTVISATTNYTINFTGAYNLADSDTITVVFPTDTDISGISAVTFNNGADATATAATYSTVPPARQLMVTVPAAEAPAIIGYTWQLVVTGVINPSSPGSYSLTVATSGAAPGYAPKEAAVSSAPYAIATPVVVSSYNAAGNFVGSDTGAGALDKQITAAQDRYVIKVGPGTFNESTTLAKSYVTVESTSTFADTIIKGLFTVNGSYNTLDDITFNTAGGGGATALQIGGNYNTIKNSTVARWPASGTASLVILTGTNNTIKDSTVDTTFADVADTAGVLVNGANSTIQNVQFMVDQSPALNGDVAISAGAAVTGLVIVGNTFTGSSGIGYSDAAGATAMIMNNKFNSLATAVKIASAGSNATITGNTIDKCTSPAPDSGAIIVSAAAANLIVSGNTISNSVGYSFNVSAIPASYSISGNQFLANGKGFFTSVPLTAVLNWWGNAAGPTTATVAGGDTIVNSTGPLTYKPFLTAATSSAATAVAAGAGALTLPSGSDASVGVTINGYTATAAGNYIVGQKLAANPMTLTPPFPAVAYFDVYTNVASTTPVQVNFYATGISSATQAYYYSGAVGNWVLCSSQGVAGTGNYVYANLTATSTPTINDLTGTAFALVTGLPPAPAAFAVNSPALGSNTGLTNIPFSWAAVTNATSYAFVLSANADLSSPVASQPNLTGTAFTYTGTLTAGPYYWQAIAYQNNAQIAKSVTGTFIAVAPAPPAPPTTQAPPVVITSVPAPTITITQPAPTTITIPQPAVEEVTPAWIWGIVGIGAVLIIVVIVLIVRTRRTV